MFLDDLLPVPYDEATLARACVNLGQDPMAFMDALPLDAVGEIHLAGFAQDTDADGAPLLIDAHGSAVDEAVWTLYQQVIYRLGPTPTLIEWDSDVPAFPTLIAQARRARRVMSDRVDLRQCDTYEACA